MTSISSPYAKADPKLRIKKGTPLIVRPTKDEIATFPAEAQLLMAKNWGQQKHLIGSGQFDLSWLDGKHILLAGATGPGLGGAFASAILGLGSAASVTVLARDLKRSLNFETGKVMQTQAEAAGMGQRFQWLNDGMALEGKALKKLLAALKTAAADRVVYINTVAAAISGLLPGMPPIYIKDVDQDGLFQWQPNPLTDREIQITKSVMGEMAVQFPNVLEDNGIGIEASVFADWRGSLDKTGRNPDMREYGRQGSYSTSLFLPKDVLQEATRQAYGTDRIVLDIFYPVMRTRALPLIPGGMTMANVFNKLMDKEDIRWIEVPELALGALDRIGKAVTHGVENPFPRLDSHDVHLDEWFFEVTLRLNDDENSGFYYKHWL